MVHRAAAGSEIAVILQMQVGVPSPCGNDKLLPEHLTYFENLVNLIVSQK